MAQESPRGSLRQIVLRVEEFGFSVLKNAFKLRELGFSQYLKNTPTVMSVFSLSYYTVKDTN